MEAADGHSADPVQADDTAGMGGTDRKLLLDILHQVLALAEMSGRHGADDVVRQLDDNAVVVDRHDLGVLDDQSWRDAGEDVLHLATHVDLPGGEQDGVDGRQHVQNPHDQFAADLVAVDMIGGRLELFPLNISTAA